MLWDGGVVGLTLHAFGLQGVAKPSYYESNHDAFKAAQAAFDLKAKLLERAPNLASFLASDPENMMQERARTELLAILDTARELMPQ